MVWQLLWALVYRPVDATGLASRTSQRSSSVVGIREGHRAIQPVALFAVRSKADDQDMEKCIRRHRAAYPRPWRTLESLRGVGETAHGFKAGHR
jgi:hypothetical protein